MTTGKHYLLASDFDQTLSFNDSGQILSDLLGVSNFQDKVEGLAASNLVQQGGELAYLIRHDPEFRGVRREHLIEAGRRVRLRSDIPALVDFLARGLDGIQFSYFVISAAPQELVQSALAGTVAAEHIIGTELDFDSRSGEVRGDRASAGADGRVCSLDGLRHVHGRRAGRGRQSPRAVRGRLDREADQNRLSPSPIASSGQTALGWTQGLTLGTLGLLLGMYFSRV